MSGVSLRHVLATIAYRGGKTLRDAPASFADFNGAGRTPVSRVAHLGDLLEWSLSIAKNRQEWPGHTPGDWKTEVARFYRVLQAFDEFLADEGIPEELAAKLFQGPLADSLTHVGQLAMMRRMAGCPTSGENYFVANVEAGSVGPEQAAPVKEF